MAILGALTGKAGIAEVTFVRLCSCVNIHVIVKALLIHETFTTVFNLAHIWSQVMWSVIVQHVTLDAAPVTTFATNFTLDLFVNPHVAFKVLFVLEQHLTIWHSALYPRARRWFKFDAPVNFLDVRGNVVFRQHHSTFRAHGLVLKTPGTFQFVLSQVIFSQEIFRTTATFYLNITIVNLFKVIKEIWPNFGFKVVTDPALCIVVFSQIFHVIEHFFPSLPAFAAADTDILFHSAANLIMNFQNMPLDTVI